MSIHQFTSVLAAAVCLSVVSSRADTLALFATPDSGTGTGQSYTISTQANKAAAVDNVTVSAITGNHLSGNANSWNVRDAFTAGNGSYITGSSTSGAGTSGTGAGKYWFVNNTSLWTGTWATPSSSSHYYQFTITADSGYTLALAGLTFDWQAAVNGALPATDFGYQVYYAIDGSGTYNAIGSQGLKSVAASSSGVTKFGNITNESIDLSTITGASSITLRIAQSNTRASAEGGIAEMFQNIQVTGLGAVPEPATYGLLGAGALAGIAFVRRRRQRL